MVLLSGISWDSRVVNESQYFQLDIQGKVS